MFAKAGSSPGQCCSGKSGHAGMKCAFERSVLTHRNEMQSSRHDLAVRRGSLRLELKHTGRTVQSQQFVFCPAAADVKLIGWRRDAFRSWHVVVCRNTRRTVLRRFAFTKAVAGEADRVAGSACRWQHKGVMRVK